MLDLFSKKMKTRKGFTIIELIVVMAVLAILVGVGAPKYLGYTKDADVTAMQTDTKIIEQAAYQYALANDDAWPVAWTDADSDSTYDVGEEDNYTVTASSNLETIINGALTDAGCTATAATLTEAFVEIDEDEVAPFIRSTSNGVDQYFMVNRITGVTGYDNQLEGYVFYRGALPDSNGDYHSGLFPAQ